VDNLLLLLQRHGYPIIFAAAFAGATGLPVPAFPFLIAAGTASALGAMNLGLVLMTAMLGMLLGDSILYVIGRVSGWWILDFMCRASVNPDTCILRSAESFYKRGRVTLVVAKFIPGISTMSPPLAGSLRMRVGQFLRLDLLGILFYILPFFALGFFFSREVEGILDRVQSIGQIALWLLLFLLIVYAVYRFRNYSRNRLYRQVPRVTAQQLSDRISHPDPSKEILIADARSHGYYENGATRIRGSIRIEPASIAEQLQKLSKDKEIYLYCT
jgi:membrane protein DedA with SNARE-associated domain